MVSQASTGPARCGSFRSDDADQVRSFLAERWGTSTSVDADGGVPFRYRYDEVLFGPFYLAASNSTAGTRIRNTDAAPSYVIATTRVGRLVATSGRARAVADPTTASVLLHGHAPYSAATSPGRLRLLSIGQEALQAHLQALIQQPVRSPIGFAPGFDLIGRLGAQWMGLVGPLLDAIDDRDNLIYRPLVAEPLMHAVMTALLLAADHSYRDALAQPAPPCRPRHVRHAIDMIRAHPDHPHTPATLARLTGVSVRTLQEGFHRHVGTSPMAYLRQIRLSHAHDDLLHGRTRTVAEAAHRWGFTHLGRFASQYQAGYGVKPSQTLRNLGQL